MELRVLPMILRAESMKLVVACFVLSACAARVAEPAPVPPTPPPLASRPADSEGTQSVAPNPNPNVASSGLAENADSRGEGTKGPSSAVDPTVGTTNASLSVDDSGSAEPRRLDLPRGTTVLHVGDSFAGALGIELNRELKTFGIRGILKYETATYIPTWAWGKDLEKYLSKYHPDLVMITLGANELEIADPAQRAPTIRHLVERLAGRPCVWVAPPLWQGARPALLDVIRESCAPCAYLDSSELVPDLPRAKDGIHPAMAARKEWAKAVVEWLGQHLRGSDALPWSIE